jgi:hypothetical protein
MRTGPASRGSKLRLGLYARRGIISLCGVLVIGSAVSLPIGVSAVGSTAGATVTCSDPVGGVEPDTVLSGSWTTDTTNLYCNLADLKYEMVWGAQEQSSATSLVTNGNVEAVDGGVWPGMSEITLESTNSSGTSNNTNVQDITTDEYDEGGIAAINWNPYDPVTQDSAYSDTYPIDDGDFPDICSYIYPGGSNYTSSNPISSGLEQPSAYFQDELQNLYDELTSLVIPDTETPLPVLLRILPEMNGGWFWWGNKGSDTDAGHCTEAEYVSVYQYVVEWLADEETANGEATQAPVSNVVSVWSVAGGPGEYDGSFETHIGYFYPGGDYVDVVGVDAFDKSDGSPVDETLPQSADVMGSLDDLANFASEQSKMPSMTSGEDGDSNTITHYWKQYFCAFAYDGACSTAPGDKDLAAMRYATVWFNSSNIFAPAPSEANDFASALAYDYAYSGPNSFTVGMAQQSSGEDSWYCADLSC